MKNEPTNDVQQFVIYLGDIPFVFVTKRLELDKPSTAPKDNKTQNSAS